LLIAQAPVTKTNAPSSGRFQFRILRAEILVGHLAVSDQHGVDEVFGLIIPANSAPDYTHNIQCRVDYNAKDRQAVHSCWVPS
jgi:hypothetical protein